MKYLSVAIILGSFLITAQAQQSESIGTDNAGTKIEMKKTTPDAGKSQNANPMNQFVDMFTKFADISVENQLKVAEKPETAARIAVFKKNLHSALIKQGFSKTEALSIVNNTPMPSPWR